MKADNGMKNEFYDSERFARRFRTHRSFQEPHPQILPAAEAADGRHAMRDECLLCLGCLTMLAGSH